MNRLITSGFTGGFPYLLDDLRWVDDSYRDALTNLLIGIASGHTSFIIQGCECDGGYGDPYTVMNEGYIMLDGEILKVDKHTVPFFFNGSFHNTHFTKRVTYNLSGNKVSKDNSYSGSTYQENRGYLSGEVGTLAYNGARFSSIFKQIVDVDNLRNRLDTIDSKINTLTSQLGTLSSATSTLTTKADKMLQVDYIGQVSCSNIANGVFQTAPAITSIYNPNSITPTITRSSEGIYDINVKQNTTNFEISYIALNNYNKAVTPKQFEYKEIDGTYGFNVFCSDDLIPNDCLFRFIIYKRPS